MAQSLLFFVPRFDVAESRLTSPPFEDHVLDKIIYSIYMTATVPDYTVCLEEKNFWHELKLCFCHHKHGFFSSKNARKAPPPPLPTLSLLVSPLIAHLSLILPDENQPIFKPNTALVRYAAGVDAGDAHARPLHCLPIRPSGWA